MGNLLSGNLLCLLDILVIVSVVLARDCTKFLASVTFLCTTPFLYCCWLVMFVLQDGSYALLLHSNHSSSCQFIWCMTCQICIHKHVAEGAKFISWSPARASSHLFTSTGATSHSRSYTGCVGDVSSSAIARVMKLLYIFEKFMVALHACVLFFVRSFLPVCLFSTWPSSKCLQRKRSIL